MIRDFIASVACQVLFELARYHAPSTIFMDELDALMGARGGEGEHEASRRMKTELLIQMDGVARGGELVFLLAATNLPWELDIVRLTPEARASLIHLLYDTCKTVSCL